MTKRTYTRRTQNQWQQLITDQQHSGLSIADYCKQHQLATSNFYTWRSKFSNSDEKRSDTSAQSDTDWLPITGTLPTTSSSSEQGLSMTLSLPGGMTLTLRSA